MRLRKRLVGVLVAITCLCQVALLRSDDASTAKEPKAELPVLPEGNKGVAARYPADAGIEKDPAVLFTEDFEEVTTVGELRRHWDNVFHDQTLRLTDLPADVHGGHKAIEMTFRQQEGPVGNGLMKRFTAEKDLLFLRYYQKFDKDLDIKGAGSFHNGGNISAHYHVNGQSTPGVRADGKNKYLASYECTVYSPATAPGNLTVYIYHPEQRSQWGDLFFPTGLVMPNTSRAGNFGPYFKARPEVKPDLDRWHCYEFMVQANTAGQRDGRIACWLDGKLIADFPNLRLRDVDTLKMDYISIGGYINPNKVRTNKIWFDDVVVATSYIGPRLPDKE